MLDHDEYDTESEDHEIDTPLGKYVLSTNNFIVFQGEFNGEPFTNIYSGEYSELRSGIEGILRRRKRGRLPAY